MTSMEYKRNEHTKVHRLAKLLIAGVIILLLGGGLKEALAVIVWIFGVNPTAYFIEYLCGYKHKHKVL